MVETDGIFSLERRSKPVKLSESILNGTHGRETKRLSTNNLKPARRRQEESISGQLRSLTRSANRKHTQSIAQSCSPSASFHQPMSPARGASARPSTTTPLRQAKPRALFTSPSPIPHAGPASPPTVTHTQPMPTRPDPDPQRRPDRVLDDISPHIRTATHPASRPTPAAPSRFANLTMARARDPEVAEFTRDFIMRPQGPATPSTFHFPRGGGGGDLFAGLSLRSGRGRRGRELDLFGDG